MESNNVRFINAAAREWHAKRLAFDEPGLKLVTYWPVLGSGSAVLTQQAYNYLEYYIYDQLKAGLEVGAPLVAADIGVEEAAKICDFPLTEAEIEAMIRLSKV